MGDNALGPKGMSGGARNVGGGTLARQAAPGQRVSGVAHGSQAKKPSWHRGDLLSLDNDKRALCSQIYFDTGKANLDPNDHGALINTVRSIRTHLIHANQVELQCHGYADVRGGSVENEALSERRVSAVSSFLAAGLQHLKGWTVLKGRHFGEKYSRDSAALWEEDRRVDVFARIIPRFRIDAAENPWIKTRTKIFELYYPRYKLWPERGLGYLVEQYEAADQTEYPIKIKPTDFEKVLDLVRQIATPEDWRLISVWATGYYKNDVISDEYCVEYRRAYDEAYGRYRKSKEYGSLNPTAPR
jgi:outer membrane protein OmpA-like peptidoglycan-associated protein